MTVEVASFMQEPFHSTKFTPDRSDTSQVDVFNDSIGKDGSDNETSTPTSNGLELLVAVRPSHLNQKTDNKVNFTRTENNINNSEHNLLPKKNIVSQIKRPLLSGFTNDVDYVPAQKKISVSAILDCPLPIANTTQRLLSQSAGSSALQSAIRRVQNNLSHSCFADLCSNRTTDIDSELTCLNWLQEGDLLNGFTPGKKKQEEMEAEDQTEKENDGAFLKKRKDMQLHLSYPLNPITEVDKSLRKPAYSFSTLIFMAIENAKDKRLPVKEIYQWIQDNFPYFQKAPIGWKNSVRHNLSLNKSFKKVDKEKCIGKGSLWTIDHEARAGLVQQLRKTATYQSYSRLPYRFYTRERPPCKRDATGRFIPNHDESEFDVAATMCSLSSPAAFYRNHSGADSICSEQQNSSAELLKLWRTYIEPRDDESEEDRKVEQMKCDVISVNAKRSSSKYTIGEFLNEVHKKLSYKGNNGKNVRSKHSTNKGNVGGNGYLNTSLDEDYEFYNSDDDSSDEDDEMEENMRKLVEKERDDDLGDSGFSEGSLKKSPLFDHAYSKSLQSLCKPQARRESKGVAALLSLANAASKELENLCKDTEQSNQKKESPLKSSENVKKRSKSTRIKSPDKEVTRT